DTSKWRWRFDEIEPQIKAAVRDLYDDPTRVLAQAELDFGQIKQTLGDAPNRLAAVDAQLADIELQEQRLLDGWQRALIEDAELSQRRVSLRDERRQLE